MGADDLFVASCDLMEMQTAYFIEFARLRALAKSIDKRRRFDKVCPCIWNTWA